MPHTDPPAVAKVKCAGGCGATIQVPQSMADMVAQERAQPPMCLACLEAQRAASRGPKGVARPSKSAHAAQDAQEAREGPAEEGDASVPPVEETSASADAGPPGGPGIITDGAPGPAPAHTTLIMTLRKQHAERGKRAQVGFSVEVHPAREDRAVPEWQLVARFARALNARARQIAPKGPGQPKGEGLGFREGIRRRALGIDRAVHMVKGAGMASSVGAKVMRTLQRLRRGKEDGDGGGGGRK